LFEIIASTDFNEIVLHGILSFLLFAGAIHVNLNNLRNLILAVNLYVVFFILGQGMLLKRLLF